MASGSCDPSAKVVAPEGMLTGAISRLFTVVSRLECIVERVESDLAPVSMPRPDEVAGKNTPLSGVGKADDVLLAVNRLDNSCDELVDLLDHLSI